MSQILTRTRKGGRKPSGIPPMAITIKIRDDQKERGQGLASAYRTCDDILRAAIDRGLHEMEAECAESAPPNGNPRDWE